METKETMIEAKQYTKECPICSKVIDGFNKKQVEYNFFIHFNSCKNHLKSMEESQTSTNLKEVKAQ